MTLNFNLLPIQYDILKSPLSTAIIQEILESRNKIHLFFSYSLSHWNYLFNYANNDIKI